jgi:hypothetical protein
MQVKRRSRLSDFVPVSTVLEARVGISSGLRIGSLLTLNGIWKQLQILPLLKAKRL